MVYDRAVPPKPPPVDRPVDPPAAAATDPPGGLTREHVVWAYRLLLDREPESEGVIGPKLAGSHGTAELRRHFLTSAEFQSKNRDYAHTNDRTFVITELDGGVRLWVDLSDHVIGLGIVRGRYEADAVRFVRGILQPGDVAVDAGAHIGFFTVQMAALVGAAGRVYAFEPLDANADLLERSIAENRFADRVVLRRAAVGDRSGAANLTYPEETLNTGGAYLLREGTAPLTDNLVSPVPLVALDDLPLERPVRLIKMDVEGAEPLIVRGAARLLAEDRPAILAEVHATQLDRVCGVPAGRFLAEMADLGYRAHHLAGGVIGAPLDRVADDRVLTVVFLPRAS